MFEKKALPCEPKLIVEADEPAILFSSVSRAESYMEPIDVRNGVYTAAFGPQGESYSFSTDGDQVMVLLDESVPHNPERLKQILIRFLNAVHVTADQRESLEEILAKCARFVE